MSEQRYYVKNATFWNVCDRQQPGTHWASQIIATTYDEAVAHRIATALNAFEPLWMACDAVGMWYAHYPDDGCPCCHSQLLDRHEDYCPIPLIKTACRIAGDGILATSTQADAAPSDADASNPATDVED